MPAQKWVVLRGFQSIDIYFHFRLILKKFGEKLKTTDEKYPGDKSEYELITDQIFLVFKGVSIVRICERAWIGDIIGRQRRDHLAIKTLNYIRETNKVVSQCHSTKRWKTVFKEKKYGFTIWFNNEIKSAKIIKKGRAPAGPAGRQYFSKISFIFFQILALNMLQPPAGPAGRLHL